MKKIILFAVVLLNCLAVCGVERSWSAIPGEKIKEIIPTNWRNVETGDWEIGLYEDCAVYESRVWRYKQRICKGERFEFVLTDGKQDVPLQFRIKKNGMCEVAKAGGKRVACQKITTKFLPDYPAKDETVIKDTGYAEGDSVTIIGWLRNMTAEEKSLGDEFGVSCMNVLKSGQEQYSATIDSDGFFRLKFPVMNTVQVYLDWRRTNVASVFEPGETYFLLCDFKTGERFFMGRNARLQNEMLAMEIPDDFPGKEDTETVAQYLERLENAKRENEEAFNKIISGHPNVSERFKEYARMNMKSERALMAGMVLSQLTDGMRRKIYAEFMNEPAKPYSLYRGMASFLDYYLYEKTQMTLSEELDGAERYYHAAPTGAEKELAAKYDKAISDVRLLWNGTASADDKEKMYKEWQSRNADLLEAGADVSQKYAVQTGAYRLACYKRAVDSLGCDNDLKDILQGRRLYQTANVERRSFDKYALEKVDAISMPAAKNMLMREHQKYLDIERQSAGNENCIKSNDGVAGIAGGKELLAKITEPFRGHYVLIDVWGTWCGPCKEALSHSAKLYEALAPYDMFFVYLASRSPQAAWKNVIHEYGLTRGNCAHYNLPRNQQSAVEKYIKVSSYPSYRLIGPEGNVMDVNADPRDLPRFLKMMQDLTNKQP